MRILFASLPMDGHFNPLTGIAVHLKDAGHDVRWYTGPSMAGKLERLGIPHLPFLRATEITGDNLADLFPERAKLRGPALIRFDGSKVMLANVGAFFEDVRAIDQQFPFDLLFCDGAFYGVRLIREKLNKRVFLLSPGPESMEDSPDVPPVFAGLKPAKNPAGRLAHRAVKAAMFRMVHRHMQTLYNESLATYGLSPISWSVLDEPFRSPDVAFLSGVPGLAYPRRQRNPKVFFAGACLPYRDPGTTTSGLPKQLGQYRHTILISQGTVDNKDPGKLIIPALEALKDTNALLVVATGHSGTQELRQRYPQSNVVIEDYVDFEAILEHSDVFICNGGSGSILLSLKHGVPVVGAGIREGKNDNNAHLDHLGLGINLRTENPKPRAIRRATDRLLTEPKFKRNAARIRDEIAQYDPHQIIDGHLSSTPTTT